MCVDFFKFIKIKVKWLIDIDIFFFLLYFIFVFHWKVPKYRIPFTKHTTYASMLKQLSLYSINRSKVPNQSFCNTKHADRFVPNLRLVWHITKTSPIRIEDADASVLNTMKVLEKKNLYKAQSLIVDLRLWPHYG